MVVAFTDNLLYITYSAVYGNQYVNALINSVIVEPFSLYTVTLSQYIRDGRKGEGGVSYGSQKFKKDQ